MINTKLSAVIMGALLIGTGGVGAVALQAHAQDAQNTATTGVDTTAAVSARPSIQFPAGGLGEDQDNNQDEGKGSEVSDDSRSVGVDVSATATVGHDQNDQDNQGEQDSGSDD